MASNDWYFPRTKLAIKMLRSLREGSGEPLCLTASQGAGKTWLARLDLSALAKKEHLHYVYADLLADMNSPAQALIAHLRSALEELTLPQSVLSDRASTPVKKITIFGSGIDLGDTAKPTEPDSPYLLIGHLIDRICHETKKKLLLVLDETQCLTSAKDGKEVSQALYSTLEKHNGRVYGIFMGSSQYAANELFGRKDSPLYGYAMPVSMEPLGADFVRFCAERFRLKTGQDIDETALINAFDRFGKEARPFIQMVSSMALDESSDVAEYRDSILMRQSKDLNYPKIWEILSPLERLVILRVVAGRELSGHTALAWYARSMGRHGVLESSVNQAMGKLKARRVLCEHSDLKAGVLEDPHLAEWIQREMKRETLPAVVTRTSAPTGHTFLSDEAQLAEKGKRITPTKKLSSELDSTEQMR